LPQPCRIRALGPSHCTRSCDRKPDAAPQLTHGLIGTGPERAAASGTSSQDRVSQTYKVGGAPPGASEPETRQLADAALPNPTVPLSFTIGPSDLNVLPGSPLGVFPGERVFCVSNETRKGAVMGNVIGLEPDVTDLDGR
jgi:hypothetical protein